MNPDQTVLNDDWSDLRRYRPLPEIDVGRMKAYRLGRIREQMRKQEVSLTILVNPISLRYAIDYRNYAQFQAHIPTTYLFVPLDGPLVIFGAYDPAPDVESRPGRPISFFDGGPELVAHAKDFAADVADYMREIGQAKGRVAIEYVNPSLTQALERAGLEVVDGVAVSEAARMVKSGDEIECIKWAVAVAELGIGKLRQAIKPGVSELQLWALLNYTNLANNGDWHDGRMVASGPRINPWCQEASGRVLEAGDLVGFDTDMIGPFGYFADISRTMFCGSGQPTLRQRQLYRLATEEIAYNTALIKPGVTLSELQQLAWPVPEEFQTNAYTCLIHAVGMCDEAPRVNPRFRGPNPYDGVIEAGMVLCVESYIGAVGERDGVKLEQQVLVTGTGTEPLSTYPYEEDLLQ